MSHTVLMRMWRIPTALLVGLICLTTVALIGAQDLHLPLADEPRFVRQAVMLALPSLLSILLVLPLPEVHRSLPRQWVFHVVTRVIFWLILVLVALVAWAVDDIPQNLILFELFGCCVLVIVAMLLVPRVGVHAVLAMTLASCIWLVFGAPVGELLGFGDLMNEDVTQYSRPAETRAWMLTLSSVLAAGLASFSSTRPA